jgi:hypothetical protein
MFRKAFALWFKSLRYCTLVERDKKANQTRVLHSELGLDAPRFQQNKCRLNRSSYKN